MTGNSRPPEMAHSTQPSFRLGTLGFHPLLKANKSIPTQLLENCIEPESVILSHLPVLLSQLSFLVSISIDI